MKGGLHNQQLVAHYVMFYDISKSSIKDEQVMRRSGEGRTSLWALVLNLFDQCAVSESCSLLPPTENEREDQNSLFPPVQDVNMSILDRLEDQTYGFIQNCFGD